MNTPNLDRLIDIAENGSRMDISYRNAEDRLAKLFATHGPALVAVLKMVPVIIDHDPNAPLCHANQLRQDCITLLTQLDQGAKA